MVHNRYRSEQPSGENRVVDQESAALVAAGEEVAHFERRSDDIATWSRPRRTLVPGRVLWSEESRRAITRELRRNRPDVVHVHNTFPLLSPSIFYACRREEVPTVVTFHNYRQVCPSGTLFRDGALCSDCVNRLPLPAVRHGCYRSSPTATAPLALESLLHRGTWRHLPSAYVFISEAERSRFAPLRLPFERTFVKHNLVPLEPPPEGVGREHKVVYVGRLSDTKGLPTLMAAWDIFAARGNASGLRLVIAGTGPLGDVVTDWSSRHPAVEYAGLLDGDACRRLVAGARAVVVPSEWDETFGLVVVEAMAVGVPAIVSRRGALPELVTDGVDGLVFGAGDAAALADMFTMVDASPERFEGLGSEALRSYRHKHDPAENLEQLLSIYRFAIENPVSGGPG